MWPVAEDLACVHPPVLQHAPRQVQATNLAAAALDDEFDSEDEEDEEDEEVVPRGRRSHPYCCAAAGAAGLNAYE